jgi:hypothetical protein
MVNEGWEKLMFRSWKVVKLKVSALFRAIDCGRKQVAQLFWSVIRTGPDRVPAPKTSPVVFSIRIYVQQLTRCTHYDPEDGGTIYLRNGGSTVYEHLITELASKVNVSLFPSTMVRSRLSSTNYFIGIHLEFRCYLHAPRALIIRKEHPISN